MTINQYVHLHDRDLKAFSSVVLPSWHIAQNKLRNVKIAIAGSELNQFVVGKGIPEFGLHSFVKICIEIKSVPFLRDARQAVVDATTPTPVRLTLEFLLANAVGQNNAKPLEEILEHLAANGYSMNGPRFQTTILADTRVGDIFIGSGQHGYFLIETEADAKAALSFYESRITSELQRIKHLKELADSCGWSI
jgi:hypothetical protein